MALGNQTFTAPKISRSNISSPLSSGASRISGVTPRLRSSRISFRSSGIGRSSLVSSQSSVETTLAETNQILVEIQNQLALDFALRNAEEKQKNQTLKEEKSRRRFALKESAVESIKKIGGAIKKTASFVATPVKGFFDKMLEFVSILGLGIGANAVFEWFADEENRKKLGKFFNIVKTNWKLIRNIFGVLVGAGLALKIAGAVATIGSVLAFLANPIVLGFLAGSALMFGTKVAYDAIAANEAGGPLYLKAHQELDKRMQKAGMTPQGNNLERETPMMYGGAGGGIGKEKPLSEEQIRIRDSVEVQRKQLRALQSNRDAELQGITDETEIQKIRNKYAIQIPGIIGAVSPEARAMGGPVSSGRVYLVGERGPEIFSPNVNGSVVNNFRTEKIYEMISSKGAGKINYITMDLPPIDARQTKSTPTPMAPEIPAISSVNRSNPYMSVTPGIYGIYV